MDERMDVFPNLNRLGGRNLLLQFHSQDGLDRHSRDLTDLTGSALEARSCRRSEVLGAVGSTEGRLD